MEKIRVLIALKSRLARELVLSVVSEQADFKVVGEIQGELAILSAIEQTKTDSLVITAEKSGRRPAICDIVFQKSPQTKILAISSGSVESPLYWFTTEIHTARIETWEGVLRELRNKVGSQ
jgi:AmiR/NasT family two-component response regulator